MKRGLLIVAILTVWGLPAAVARGQERAESIKYIDLDKKIVKACYDAALLGTEIFNKGNYDGCYRLYQGTLMALQPILDYRPMLMFKVKDRLERAKSMRVVEAANELRLALDEIQNEIAPPAKTAEPKIEPKVEPRLSATLYERLGGSAGVTRLINQVILVGVEDPRVNLFRSKKHTQKELEAIKVAALRYISSITGGPLPYDPKEEKAAVAGVKLTNEEYSALLGVIEVQLKRNDIAPIDIKDLMTKLENARKDFVDAKPKQ